MSVRLTGQDWLSDPATQAVIAALEAAGGPGCARFVGGCVRNALMGQGIDDVDIATTLKPEQTKAAIEAAGLKGVRVGGAEVSRVHANFIVNRGDATARDVYQLMRLVQDRVYAQSGIWLVPEVELVGRWTAEELAALAAPPGTRS